MPTAYIATAAALMGFLLGSFLNVCIVRLPNNESVVHPCSRCPLCGQAIAAWDNIPIISWLLLRGRCRHCKGIISALYPLVELAVTAWFVLCLFHFANLQNALNTAVLGFLLIGLAVMDWQTHLLPDEFTLGGIGLGLAFCFTRATLLPADLKPFLLTTPERMMLARLAAVAAAFLLLFTVRWAYRLVRKREGMGLGDAKLLAMLAAFLGLKLALLALFVGVLMGALYATALLLTRRAEAASRLPFGSFLALGGLLTAFNGPRLLLWYAGFFR